MGKARVVDISQALVLDLEHEAEELVIAMLFRVNVCRYGEKGRDHPEGDERDERDERDSELKFQSLRLIQEFSL